MAEVDIQRKIYMEPDNKNSNNVSRRKALQMCGSIMAGGTIFGIFWILLRKILLAPGNIAFCKNTSNLPGGKAKCAGCGIDCPLK